MRAKYGRDAVNKQCPRCKVIKPLSEFHLCRRTRDGHKFYCKECRSQLAKEYVSGNSRVQQAQRERARRWRKNNPSKNYATQKRYNQKYPEIYKAHNVIHTAKRSGKIISPTTCDICGNLGKLEAHHPDYSKPMRIQWLCNQCHSSITWKKLETNRE